MCLPGRKKSSGIGSGLALNRSSAAQTLIQLKIVSGAYLYIKPGPDVIEPR